MKKYIPVLTGILLVLMTACGDTKKKNQQTEGTSSQLNELGKIDEGAKLSQAIEGQWKTEGGEGIVPHWREFNTSNNSFYTWSHNGIKSSEPSGTYEVIGDTVLLLNFNNNKTPFKYGWNNSENGTNDSGFSALPAGKRSGFDGNFANIGETGYWWSSTEDYKTKAFGRVLLPNTRYGIKEGRIYKETEFKESGFSVRCLRD